MTVADENGPIRHPWSAEAFLIKAQRYVDEMQSTSPDDWKYVLWSTFTLEMLARAAVAHVSPALLADSRDWHHVYYSLGFQPTQSRYVPRSAGIGTVLNILGELDSSFDTDFQSFVGMHMERRNEEVHTGATPLDALGSSRWLPRFYEGCSVLLRFMGREPADLFGSAEATRAAALIEAARDESAKAVQKHVRMSAAAWTAKQDDERAILSAQAELWASRHFGHCVVCPACGSPALVTGEAMAPPHQAINDDVITETQQYLPSHFECVACGLKIGGLSQLIAAGLGDTFIATSTFDAVDLYQPEDPYPGYEPDYND
jgi:hypothetical protein